MQVVAFGRVVVGYVSRALAWTGWFLVLVLLGYEVIGKDGEEKMMDRKTIECLHDDGCRRWYRPIDCD